MLVFFGSGVVSLGKALHTHYLVLSETDVKPGGPPDGNGIFYVHMRVCAGKPAALVVCTNVNVVYQVLNLR